jgi:soluble lytic murein transglycosylase
MTFAMTEAANHPSQRVTCPQRTIRGVHSANRPLRAFAVGALALFSAAVLVSTSSLANEPSRQFASANYATDQLSPTELPAILSAADAARYERIFALQDAGRLKEADHLIAALRDKTLLGHVQAQRYLGRHHKSSYGELAAWLQAYGDHADARQIYALALKKKPAKAAAPKAPSPTAPLGYSVFSGAIEPPAKPWNAAIAAFRDGQYAAAAKGFEAIARTPKASPWVLSAGAYWAARANMLARQPQKVTAWLEEAARHSRTFYGLIARETLGLEPDLDLRTPPLNARDLAALIELPGGKRAAALLQIGDAERAERELTSIGTASPAASRAALALAGRANMPNLSLRLGNAFSAAGDEAAHRDAAIYPVPGWRPPEGYDIDRALIFAVMRQESAFNIRARSPMGASGLMQLMPATASYMAEGERFRGNARERLFEPETNISLGQRYIRYLLADPSVANNLIMLAVAYNGGPGNLAKWVRQTGNQSDPLLFIETIPSRETRIFVERVMANLWIYRMRLGQPNASLAAVAGGAWPIYAALDGMGDGDVRVADASRDAASPADALNREELDQIGPPAGSMGILGTLDAE